MLITALDGLDFYVRVSLTLYQLLNFISKDHFCVTGTHRRLEKFYLYFLQHRGLTIIFVYHLPSLYSDRLLDF
jgi:hypothetical protein